MTIQFWRGPYFSPCHTVLPACVQQVMRRIVDDRWPVKYPPYMSPAARDLIMRLLERKPVKRIGMLQNRAKDIKQHEWFRVSGAEVFWCCGAGIRVGCCSHRAQGVRAYMTLHTGLQGAGGGPASAMPFVCSTILHTMSAAKN